jgi:hypothetical protein
VVCSQSILQRPTWRINLNEDPIHRYSNGGTRVSVKADQSANQTFEGKYTLRKWMMVFLPVVHLPTNNNINNVIAFMCVVLSISSTLYLLMYTNRSQRTTLQN